MTPDDIAKKYCDIYQDAEEWEVLDFLYKYPNRYIANEHMVMIYVRIDQFMLDQINANPACVDDEAFIDECLQWRGEHIYILKGFGDARGYRELIRRLAFIWEPKSISYHRDKDNFRRAHVLYERKVLCPS